MLTKPLLIACLLSLLPICYGYAQSDAYALQHVLQRYTESYGGFRDADALSSLSVEGTIEQNGQKFDFLMRKKRPYSMRYRLSNESNSVISGYNGSQAWMRTETNGLTSTKSIDGEGERALREQARFDSPLFRHSEKRENTLELVERATLDDRSVYVIEVIKPGSDVSRYYLDVATAHLVRVDQLDADGEIRLQTLYRDYRDVEGYPFAHEIETRVASKTLSLAKINTIEVNPGLLSFYFQKPNR